MYSFFALISKILSFSWFIFILLLIYTRVSMPEKYRAFIREQKWNAVMILLVLIGLPVWFAFSEDAEFRFVCQKETQRCDYHHSTLFNKELRIADSYSLDGINDTSVKKIKRPRSGRRRWATKTVYMLAFNGPEKNFEMPKDFYFQEDALEQAEKAGAFLRTDAPEYVYTETSDPAKKIRHVSLFMLGNIGILGCFLLLMKIGKKNTPTKTPFSSAKRKR